MSDIAPALKIDVPKWVDRAKTDPVAHLQRQAAEITLNTIAMTSPLNRQLVLKGGLLMGLAYGSPRQTSDIDLSAVFAANSDVDKRIEETLNSSFPNVAAALGYSDVVLVTHSVKKMPKPSTFDDASFPALKLKICYARRGSKEAEVLLNGKPVNSIFEVDISFNEPLQQTQILSLSGGGDILAYDLTDLIAEKYRAMLQQVERNRNRRQDVYDLHFLISNELTQEADPSIVLGSFLKKSLSRNIKPNKDSLDDLEVKDRSAKEWQSMALEIGELPDFEEAFELVREFYRGLPWD